MLGRVIESHCFQFIKPSVSLRFGKFLATPGAKLYTDDSGATIVNDDSVFIIFFEIRNQYIGAREPVLVYVTLQLNLSCHNVTTVFHGQSPNVEGKQHWSKTEGTQKRSFWAVGWNESLSVIG